MITDSDTALLRLLGQSMDSPAVTQAVAELSLVPARELKVNRGLVDLRSSDHGLDITFKPAAKLRDAPAPAVAADELILAVIFFYSDGFEGYRGYSGILPFGLSFAQSRSTVRALLGTPSGSSAQYKNDRWDRDLLYITVDFNDDEQSIQLITVGLPWKPRDAS